MFLCLCVFVCVCVLPLSISFAKQLNNLPMGVVSKKLIGLRNILLNARLCRLLAALKVALNIINKHRARIYYFNLCASCKTG